MKKRTSNQRPCGRQPLARSTRARRASQPLAVFKAAIVASCGILIWGWLVSTFPSRFSTPIAFEMPAATGDVAAAMDALRATLLGPKALQEVARVAPQVEAEFSAPQAVHELQSRTSLAVEPTTPGRQRVTLRVACSNASASAAIGRQIADQFLRGKIAPVDNKANQRKLADAEARCLRAAKALSDANHALEAARRRTAPDASANANAFDAKLRLTRQRIAELAAAWNRIVPASHDAPPAGGESMASENDSLAHSALREVYRQRAELVANFTDKHPAVRSLERKIKELAEAAGVEDVEAWMSQSKPSTLAANQTRQRADGDVQQVGAWQIELTALREEEQRLLESKAAADDAARGRHEKATAAPLDAVKNLQRQWHAALAEKQKLQEAARSTRLSAEAGFRRCLDPLNAVRFEGPHRGRWFAIGSGLWLAICCFVTGFRKVHGLGIRLKV